MMNEMTAEEAIKWLKDIERSFPEAYFGEWRKALRMAIQALEAQPTEMRDATEEERKSVRDYIASISKPTGVQLEAQPCEDCISREAVINTIFYKSDNSCDVVLSTDLMDRIKHLPFVTPQRPKGKWTRDLRMWFTRFSCSNCGKFCDFVYLYCPNCGAEMSGDGEDV